MGQYVGLDVSLETTKVHVLDDQGKRVGTCVTHPTAIEATICKHAPEVVRIGLDTDDLAVAGADRRRLADGLPRRPPGRAEPADQQDR